MDWHRSVFRITGPDNTRKPQGTGFLAHSDGETLYIVTCWHVVHEIQASGLDIHIREHRCRLVSEPSDEDLDFAVLTLPAAALKSAESDDNSAPLGPLVHTRDAKKDLRIEIYGYGPEGRLLRGQLGSDLNWPHNSGRDIRYWDYYLDATEDVGAFERIKDGYSGSPAYDPLSKRVVAVITHRVGDEKGHAIDIQALPRVFPEAANWFESDPSTHPPEREDDAAEVDNEYSGEPDVALAKILDHQDQLSDIRRRLRDARRDRLVVLVDAGGQNAWPEYLADHMHLDPWPDDHRNAPGRVELYINPRDDDGFWQELVKKTPKGSDAKGPQAQREQVRRWVNEKGLLVLYASVFIERHGRRLAQLLAGAQTALDELGDFSNPDACLVVLFACMPEGSRVPFWWPWLDRLKLRHLPDIVRPPALQRLTRADVQVWHDTFPKRLRRDYDRGELKRQLLRLFDSGNDHIRYSDVCDCLIGDPAGQGALAAARRRPR